MNTQVRVSRRRAEGCEVSRASRYPPTIRTGVMIAVYFRVKTNETQNWWSSNARR
jgi:hypothetical protein